MPALVQFTLTGTLKNAAGVVYARKPIAFIPSQIFGGSGVSVLPNTISAITADDGTFTVTLYTVNTANAFIRYAVVPPEGNTFNIDIATTSPTTLDALYDQGELANAGLTAILAAIAGKQPLDTDLTAIAALDSATAGVMATEGSGWVRRTYAQIKTSLGLTKSDVGLSNVANTADADKPVSTAQAAGDTAVQAFAIQRANHTGTQTIATVTGLQTAIDLKAPLASPALTGMPTAPTAAVATNTTQIATTAFVLANGGGGGSPAAYALRFDGTKNHHVDHGAFWTPANTYGVFVWDALVRPTGVGETGYVISAGYGPSHNLLWGFNTDATMASITGNIYMNGVLTSFSSPPVIPLGQWAHVLIQWDLSAVIVYVNGLVVSATPASGTLRTATGGADNVLFVGGSDHSNSSCDLAWIRGFENTVPTFGGGGAYAPLKTRFFPLTSFYEGGVVKKAVFAADYTNPGGSIIDIADGLGSVRHNGYRGRGVNIGDFDNPSQLPTTSLEADLPQWVTANIVKYAVPATPSIPAGARISDSFTSRDITPFWDDRTSWTLGNTEGGTLGIKTWSVAEYCIMYGSVVAGAISPGPTVVDNVVTDIDLRSTYSAIVYYYTNYIDGNNYLQIANTAGNNLIITKRVAGVDTTLAGPIAIAASGEMRIVKSGTSVTVSVDGVTKATVTATGLTGTKTGFHLHCYNFGRVVKFDVY